MTNKEERFVGTVFEYYETHGRHTLPWRLTHDPYKILVSELMLQQTQVERVIPKYEAFVKRWPTASRLASASLAEVLIAWQGLGYNRRAKFLHECAKEIAATHKGVFPQTEKELQTLPGVGYYTAAAICAFAYNQPVVLIETNVRRVFIHHFFPTRDAVTDTEILRLVKKTLPSGRSREWYAALMDYGTFLKREHGNANVRSKHYTKQSTFTGSDRQIRGAILRALIHEPKTKNRLVTEIGYETERIETQLQKLCDENLIHFAGRRFVLGSAT